MSEFFTARDPEEIVVLTFNLNTNSVLDAGESVTAATWTVEVEGGNGTDLTAMKIGVPDIFEAGKVKQKVQGGTVNIRYLHRAKITTSAGRVLVVSALQLVQRGA